MQSLAAVDAPPPVQAFAYSVEDQKRQVLQWYKSLGAPNEPPEIALKAWCVQQIDSLTYLTFPDPAQCQARYLALAHFAEVPIQFRNTTLAGLKNMSFGKPPIVPTNRQSVSGSVPEGFYTLSASRGPSGDSVQQPFVPNGPEDLRYPQVPTHFAYPPTPSPADLLLQQSAETQALGKSFPQGQRSNHCLQHCRRAFSL